MQRNATPHGAALALQVEGLRRRDEAMQFKCKGGMMDCDGDRREYARKQADNFVAKATGAPGADVSCKARALQGWMCIHARTRAGSERVAQLCPFVGLCGCCVLCAVCAQVEEACTTDILGAAISRASARARSWPRWGATRRRW
jgi:hypothetical protein